MVENRSLLCIASGIRDCAKVRPAQHNNIIITPLPVMD